MAIKKWEAPELPPPLGSGGGGARGSRRVLLAGAGAPSASQEAFERLAALFLARFRACPAHTFQALWPALEGATDELLAGRGVSEAQAHRLRQWLARDLALLAAALVRGPRASAEAVRQAAASDTGALSKLLEVLALSGDALYRVAGEHHDAPIRTGDVTCSGALACNGCGRAQRSRVTHTVDQCRNCHGDSFSKVF